MQPQPIERPSKINNDKPTETCVICFEENLPIFCLFRCYNTKCGKYICVKCKNYIQNRKKCPLCTINYSDSVFSPGDFVDVLILNWWVPGKVVDCVTINHALYYVVHPIGFREKFHHICVRSSNTITYYGHRTFNKPSILTVTRNIENVKDCMDVISKSLARLDYDMDVSMRLLNTTQEELKDSVDHMEVSDIMSNFVHKCDMKIDCVTVEMKKEAESVRAVLLEKYMVLKNELESLREDMIIVSRMNE